MKMSWQDNILTKNIEFMNALKSLLSTTTVFIWLSLCDPRQLII